MSKISFLFPLVFCIGCSPYETEKVKPLLLSSPSVEFKAMGLILENTEKILQNQELIKHELGIKGGFDLDNQQSSAIMSLRREYETETSSVSSQFQILENQIISLQDDVAKLKEANDVYTRPFVDSLWETKFSHENQIIGLQDRVEELEKIIKYLTLTKESPNE